MNVRQILWIGFVFICILTAACSGKSPETVDAQRMQEIKTQTPALNTDELSPNRLALAKDLVDKAYYDVALVQLKSAMEAHSSDATVYNLAGVCARETNDFKAAETYLNKAKALSPDNASVHNNLGILYAMTGQTDKAETALNTAVLLDPGRADYMNNLGYFYLSRKNLVQAEATFKKALALNPEYEPALNNLVISLGLQHKDSQAMDLLLAHNDVDTAWHNMAYIYTMRNEPEKAEKLKEFIHTSPKEQTGSAFDIQEQNAKGPSSPGVDHGISGDVADLIYGKKYQNTMQSDPKGISSSSSN